MRKVFLDDLPRMNGYDGKRIDWKETINHKIRFLYDEIDDYVEIIDYTKNENQLLVKYGENELKIKTSHFRKCCIGRLLGKYTDKFKFNIGQNINDNERNIVIIDRDYKEKPIRNNARIEIRKWYKYKCEKCSYEGWMEESNLIQGCGCSCCRGLTAVLGINTIWDTDRYLVDLGMSERHAKSYTKGSGEKILVTCPDCEREKYIIISDLCRRKSIGCSCGNSFSYSEKFVYQLLNQLEIEFISQLTKSNLDWCDKYRYDFYLPGYNIIIETHGEQHYKYTGFNRTLNDEQRNDSIKKELALKNNIEKYITIDCRNSNMDWIKNNILKSELSNLFDLSEIDWKKCEMLALRNMVKEICSYWNSKNEEETTIDLARIFKLSDVTVRRYLNKGSKIWDWCNYDGKEEMKKTREKLSKKFGKRVEILKDGVLIETFDSSREISRKSKDIFGVELDCRRISEVCLGKKKEYRGYTFKYVE